MSIFAIGDTHLSFGTDKPMDIFGGWSDYTERLSKKWNLIIDENDTVVIPGDISWAMSFSEAIPDFKFLNDLPGKKIILKGNHDYWWNTRKKMDSFLAENHFDSISILHNDAYRIGDFAVCGSRGWFYDAEKSADKKVLMREAGRLRMSLDQGKKLGGEIICFLHYPPITLNQVCEEIFDVLKEYDVKRCFYGHLHGESVTRAFTGTCEEIKFGLVSGDFLEFCPRLIEKI